MVLYNTTIQQNTQGGITIKDNPNYVPVGSETTVPPVKPVAKKPKKKRKPKK